MWIEPNGVVKILQNVPLDNEYNNTLYFADRNAQTTYFNSRVKYTYNKITYQRVKRNYMRVEINAENLYDCNYLMFQNSSFGNRWFYAFIIKVEYVANMVSEIEYEIDEMQSWFWDCQMKECFVEREHSVYDSIHSNLIEEQLELGPYHNSEYKFPSDGDIPLFNSMKIVFGCTFYDDGGTFVEYGINNSGGIVSALNYVIFDITEQGILDCNDWIDRVTRDQKANGVVTAYLMPSYFARELTGTTFTDAISVVDVETYNPYKVGGYTPKNKKLLSYPYKFLHMTDFHGQSAEYRYEFFGGNLGQYSFRYTMGMTPEPSMLCVPLNYMGNSSNYNEFFVFKAYPLVGYGIDGFKMWLSQNWGTLISQDVAIASNLFSTYTGLANNHSALTGQTGNVSRVGGLTSPLVSAFGQMMTVAQHTKMPTHAKNNPSADAQWVGGLRSVGFCDMHITYNYAKRIDDFFSMFGYKTNEVKIPNINSRPHWNYIKTTDANIVGSIPADSLRTIIDIFNRGITFWKNGSEVGDYSLDNSPT